MREGGDEEFRIVRRGVVQVQGAAGFAYRNGPESDLNSSANKVDIVRPRQNQVIPERWSIAISA
jgi:hypothetical protein